jgi:hypothetical protein
VGNHIPDSLSDFDKMMALRQSALLGCVLAAVVSTGSGYTSPNIIMMMADGV